MLTPTLNVVAAGTYTTAGGVVYLNNAAGNVTIQVNAGVDGALLAVRNIDRLHTNTLTSGSAALDPAYDPISLVGGDNWLFVYRASENTWRAISTV